MRVIRDASRRDVLVGADADVIDTDNVGNLIEASYLSRLRKKCQMPTAPPVSATARAWSALTCRAISGVGPIARDPSMAVCDNSRGFVATPLPRLGQYKYCAKIGGEDFSC